MSLGSVYTLGGGGGGDEDGEMEKCKVAESRGES